MSTFFTVMENAADEITVKKSRFIAEVYRVQSVDEAKEFIRQVQKKYHDAKHHCFAYRVFDGTLEERMNDDGEPSGTAGATMLTILQGKELVNTLVIVTRYFGGVLLGTRRTFKSLFRSSTKCVK